MPWLSRMLVCALVAAGISVAVVSGCQSFVGVTLDGGSWSQTQIEPFAPLATLTDVAVPGARFELFGILAAVCLLLLPTLETAFPPRLRNQSRGSPKLAFLPMRN